VSSVTQRSRTDCKTARSGRAPASDPAASLQELKAEARRCHTPQQFRLLLEDLRGILPYQKLAGVWGHPIHSIHHVFNYGIPVAYLRWFLSTGALWTSPVFREWRRNKRAVMVFAVVKRFKTDFNPELVKQYKQAGLYYAMCGGRASANHFVYFVVAMSSARTARTNLKQFDSIVPSLVQASQRAYPRSLITKREMAILERRAMGQIAKQIAIAEGISERMVREHLEHIKKKLYTDNLVNAVVIAMKSGMLLSPWNKTMSEHQDDRAGLGRRLNN
jgi:DNA-binding CsgD family transcriptional regulator